MAEAVRAAVREQQAGSPDLAGKPAKSGVTLLFSRYAMIRADRAEGYVPQGLGNAPLGGWLRTDRPRSSLVCRIPDLVCEQQQSG